MYNNTSNIWWHKIHSSQYQSRCHFLSAERSWWTLFALFPSLSLSLSLLNSSAKEINSSAPDYTNVHTEICNVRRKIQRYLSDISFRFRSFLLSLYPTLTPRWHSLNPRGFLAGTKRHLAHEVVAPKSAAFSPFRSVRPSSKLSNKPLPVGACS